MTHETIVEEGVHVLYEELGPEKTIRFFQLVGVQRGDTLKEIEEITRNLSKQDAINLVRKVKRN